MTIDDAIKNLQDAKRAGHKNIVLAWWDASCFSRQDDETWAGICEYLDDKMDWANAHDDITETIRYIESNILNDTN